MASGDTKESNVTEDVSSTDNDKAADFSSRSNNHSSEFFLYLCLFCIFVLMFVKISKCFKFIFYKKK